jgi:glycerate 2-kinase
VTQVTRLRDEAISIWQAGVEAVDSGRLVRNVVQTSDSGLVICGHEISLATVNRIVVVGAGKAGTGMATAFEQALGESIVKEKVSGWINVPADCLPADGESQPRKIHLHPARPAGVNEPTGEGVRGAREILNVVSGLGPDDVCVVLLSGGGSALLPAPVEGISLADKQDVTRLLMNAGATINDLNCVRKQLSQIKGGGLARAAKAGLVLTLIISDVIEDPLDVIASGPTIADSSTAAEALEILQKYSSRREEISIAVWEYLTAKKYAETKPQPIPETVHNYVIGNNEVALNAASQRARDLGYQVHSLGSDNQGEARIVGRELAELCRCIRDEGKPLSSPACLLSGGEPVVHVVETDQPQKGGRNQELVLAGLELLWDDGMDDIVLLSGGTDGEDGPTDAAGAVADSRLLQAAQSQAFVPGDYLAVNNSYPFFDQIGGLLKTGPTHTNVMDLRVCLVGAPEGQNVSNL